MAAPKALRPSIAALCAAATLACVTPAAARAEPAATKKDDIDAEYRAMTEPVMRFLDLVNRKFPGRECVRDRSHLADDYDKVALSLAQMFVIRDDLRKDLRELAMRLATFQTLPADVRHLAIPMAIPPATDSEKAMNAMVYRARTALWKKLDELEAQFPATAAAETGKLGLIITTDDTGWRPDKPTRLLHKPNECGPA
jgi:BMFP domain-containing protein YqiC